MGLEVGGLLGLVVLGLSIWAIITIFQSAATPGVKTLWILLILILPVIGLVVWFLFGPGSARP
jgi:hypothetical protein